MSIDLPLPKKSQFETKKFKLESSTLDTLNLYESPRVYRRDFYLSHAA
jgi:hypothetical protein